LWNDASSLFWRQVWQPAHTLRLKRVVARERAALFTDLPQMRVELSWGQFAEYQSMRLPVLSTAVAARAGVLCCALLMVISAQALAQAPATDNPSPAAAQPAAPVQEKPEAASEEKPPAADDKPAIVEQKPAPAEEKSAVAQDKPAVVEEKPAATDDKPAIVEQKPAPAEEKPAVAHKKPALKQKSAARPSESAVRSTVAEHSKSAQPAKSVQPATAAHKPRERTLVMLCTRFRTYNPSSGTYRGYDGRTYSCR
jgi:outer membrane biosynthesis protein TonB